MHHGKNPVRELARLQSSSYNTWHTQCEKCKREHGVASVYPSHLALPPCPVPRTVQSCLKTTGDKSGKRAAAKRCVSIQHLDYGLEFFGA